MNRVGRTLGCVVVAAAVVFLAGGDRGLAQGGDQPGAPVGAFPPLPPIGPPSADQYPGAAPLPPLPPSRTGYVLDPIDENGQRTRASLGLANDAGTLELARVQFGARLQRGPDRAGVALTDAEYDLFVRWKDLVDAAGLDNLMASNQSVVAEKIVSRNIADPWVDLYLPPSVDPGLRQRLLDSAPAGLRVGVRDASWTGQELERFRISMIAASASNAPDPIVRTDGSDETQFVAVVGALKQNGFTPTNVEREVPQRLRISLPKGVAGPAAAVVIVNALAVQGRIDQAIVDTVTFDEADPPVFAAATRETDPGPIHAGLRIGGGPGTCTSNVGVTIYGGTYSGDYVVTAGHCFSENNFSPGSSIEATYAGQAWSRNGHQFGTSTWRAWNTPFGNDIGLIRVTSGGMMSGLYHRNKASNFTVHYGISNNAATGGPGSTSSWACLEGASAHRINVPGTSGTGPNAAHSDRCGHSNMSSYSTVPVWEESPGGTTNVITCEGDSGGLVHDGSGNPMGIMSYRRGPETSPDGPCSWGGGFAVLRFNLDRFTTAGGGTWAIHNWPNFTSTWSLLKSRYSGTGISASNCVHGHDNGGTGQPSGGWLQTWPSSYFAGSNCSISTIGNPWRWEPQNDYFPDGDIWQFRSGATAYCITAPGGNTANWTIATRQTCTGFADQLFRLEPTNQNYAYFRSYANQGQCLSIRDPGNSSDPHWTHYWQCITHDAQQWRPN